MQEETIRIQTAEITVSPVSFNWPVIIGIGLIVLFVILGVVAILSGAIRRKNNS